MNAAVGIGVSDPDEEMEMAGGLWSKLFGGNGLPRPREIPDHVGRYLVTRMKKNPDWVWKQMAVVLPRNGKRGCFDVRVYDIAQARSQQISVRDFHSLDNHPELIMFEGWFDKNTGEIDIVEKSGAAGVPGL